MRRKFFLIFSALVVLSMALSATGSYRAVSQAPASHQLAKVEKFDAHYVVPKDGNIELLLEEEGIPLDKMSAEQKQQQVQAYAKNFHDKNPDTPYPDKLQKLLDTENKQNKHVVAGRDIKSLVVPVEFPNSDTFAWCGETVTTAGPLHNQVPPPGPRDNNTVWYADATPQLYEELYFGEGPEAGVIIEHPSLGTVDLHGKTLVNYYLENSGGLFAPAGMVYPQWLQAAHSEAWYGADNCSGSNHNVRAADLVREVVDAVKANAPAFDWQSFDGNADGVVDNFTVVHAGMGQESGGGLQGTFSIWSHASALNLPTGYLACAKGAPGCTDRDIYVREYSMDPENIDLGVIAEEFGHAAFGLPDLYTTDYQASMSNWAIMEAGSWNGILGGMEPAPFPLWFKTLVGWAHPRQLAYDSPEVVESRVGQLELTPHNTWDGLQINLPDQVINTPNPLGTGKAWWSDRADVANFHLAHEFDLTGTTAPIFSFASYWSFEADYDYGYVQVSEDGGATWVYLPDMDGIFVDDGAGHLGLNDEGQGTLRFDLTPFAGKQITLRLLYTSDVGVQWAGWWADDLKLADGATTLFYDDVEAGTDGWTTNKWTLVPLTRIYPLYYLVEWRNNQGFDHGLQYPYQTVYNDEVTNEWEVDRTPYSVPGMLVYIRNGAYDFDYTLSDSWYNPPSYGPKHGLLLVDSHYWPLTWNNYKYTSGANLRITSRAQPSNAAFTLQPTTPFTIRLGYNPSNGQYVDTPLETKTFAAQPPVTSFHDSMGYYPGLWFRPASGGLYFWQVDASAVVPAMDNYTTRITGLDKKPFFGLYGYDMGDTVLGSGNPGDNGVQYGVNIAITSQAADGTWGQIVTWNSKQPLESPIMMANPTVKAGDTLAYALQVRNDTPAPLKVTLSAPIPEKTTYSGGMKYDPVSQTATWSATIPANAVQTVNLRVRVNKNTPAGTLITNFFKVTDEALGSQSQPVTVKVVK